MQINVCSKQNCTQHSMIAVNKNAFNTQFFYAYDICNVFVILLFLPNSNLMFCFLPLKYSSPPQLRYPQSRNFHNYAILNWVKKTRAKFFFLVNPKRHGFKAKPLGGAKVKNACGAKLAEFRIYVSE